MFTRTQKMSTSAQWTSFSTFTSKTVMKVRITTTLLAFMYIFSLAQDEVIYKPRTGGFYQDSILPAIKSFGQKESKDQREHLTLDFSSVSLPGNPGDYNAQWHNAPLSQGATGTCWCFATISFLESEAYRLKGRQLKFSEMYIVYWEYVARAEYFVDHRGDMYFGQGSEANAVTRTMKIHGLVPAGQYTGLKAGQRFHDHGALAQEVRSYLDFIRENNMWDRQAVVSNVRSTLDHYLGPPPQEVSFEGKRTSPLSFMQDVAGLNPDDYYCFMSTRALPYDQKGELKEPDNWWHNDDYYNIPLDDFSALLKQALGQGYSVAFCGDNSEPGYDRFSEVSIIPSFDIPGEHIDANAREFRLYNGSTTDDHCMHMVGHTNLDGRDWYLIKDSASSGFDGPNKGYRFMRDDYVKLKVMAVMTHKDAARKVLDRIIK